MKRIKFVQALLIFAICIGGILFWVFKIDDVTLAANKTGSKQVDDFVLHIRVENVDGGIKVYRSIQYVGDDPIEITHHTPLVSVSLKNRNHDFTGSPVVKKLKKGYSYHPQISKTIQSPKKGTYDLYCKAKFSVNGKQITIDHIENLTFE